MIPKRELARIILTHSDPDEIRHHFGIRPGTDLEGRLASFTRAKLLEYVAGAGGVLADAVNSTQEQFPLRRSPTLYVFHIGGHVDVESVRTVSRQLARTGREVALLYPDHSSVRAVYVLKPLQRVPEHTMIYELVLAYERRMEFTVCDPASDRYGELEEVYSLEIALVWFPSHRRRFGVVACCDFVAVKRVIQYLNTQFAFKASLPDLSEQALLRLASGGVVKTATFGRVGEGDPGSMPP